MQSAADQLRAEFSRVLARSSSKLAYSEGSTPEFRTESSAGAFTFVPQASRRYANQGMKPINAVR